jgi:hypothetical protein
VSTTFIPAPVSILTTTKETFMTPKQPSAPADKDLGAGGVDIAEAGIDPDDMVELPQEQVIEDQGE